MAIVPPKLCSVANYPAVLEWAVSLQLSGKPHHSRMLLSRAEAYLRSVDYDVIVLTESQKEARCKILNYIPSFSLNRETTVEVSFNPSMKLAALHPPKSVEGDIEAIDDEEQPSILALTLDAIINLYRNDRILEAFAELSTLDIINIDKRTVPEIEGILQDYDEIQLILNSFSDQDDWLPEVTKGDVLVHTKMSPDLPTISVKSEGEMDIPIWHLLCLLYESDLYSEWVPFCRESRTIAKLTRVRKVIYQYFKLPLLADREVILHGYGVNILKQSGAVLVVGKSVPDESEFKGVAVPPPTGGNIRAQLNFFGALIRPVTRTRTHMQMISNVDPRLKRVPYKLLNWCSRKFARKMFKMIRKQAKKFEGSVHQKRMESGEEFYQYVGQSLEEYFTANGL